MPASVEESVKEQFSQVFKKADWPLFKTMGEVYLKQAAFLRKKHVVAPPGLKLLARNAQKRLFIGIGVELLLKAVYLKAGYVINKPKDPHAPLKLPFTPAQARGHQLDPADTYTLDKLIGKLLTVLSALQNGNIVLRGLRVAKVFRNKEGHSVTPVHLFAPSNYRDIEASLSEVYEQVFDETLAVRFSVAVGEKPVWRITHPNKTLQRTAFGRRRALSQSSIDLRTGHFGGIQGL